MQKNIEIGGEAPLDLTMPRERMEGEYVEYEDKSPKKEPEEIKSPKKEPEEIKLEPGDDSDIVSHQLPYLCVQGPVQQLPSLPVQDPVLQLPSGLDGQILFLEDLDFQHALLADCGDHQPLADFPDPQHLLAETPDQLHGFECPDALPPSTRAIFNQIRAILGGPPLEDGADVDYPVLEVPDEVSDQPPSSPSSDVLPPSIRANFNRIRALLNQPPLEDGGAMEDDVVHLDEARNNVRDIYNHVAGRGDNNNGASQGYNNNWAVQGDIVDDEPELEVLDEVVVIEDPDDAEISIEDEILDEGGDYAGQDVHDVDGGAPAVYDLPNRYAAPVLYCVPGEGEEYLVEERPADHHSPPPLARYGLTLDDLCSAALLCLQVMGLTPDRETFRRTFLVAANVLREDDNSLGGMGI